MSEGVSCKRTPCPGQATWVPVIAVKGGRDGDELKGELKEIGVCEMHRQTSKLEDFLSPEGWDKIQRYLKENGKGTFLRRSARLEWRRSRNPELLPF